MLIGVIGLINSLALYNTWYWRYRFLDMPMHFLGGVFISVFILWIMYVRKKKGETLGVASRKELRLVALTAILIVGLSWEVFEFRSDVWVVFAHMFSWADTVSDLMCDLLGATFGVLWFEKYYYSVEEVLMKQD